MRNLELALFAAVVIASPAFAVEEFALDGVLESSKDCRVAVKLDLNVKEKQAKVSTRYSEKCPIVEQRSYTLNVTDPISNDEKFETSVGTGDGIRGLIVDRRNSPEFKKYTDRAAIQLVLEIEGIGKITSYTSVKTVCYGTQGGENTFSLRTVKLGLNAKLRKLQNENSTFLLSAPKPGAREVGSDSSASDFWVCAKLKYAASNTKQPDQGIGCQELYQEGQKVDFDIVKSDLEGDGVMNPKIGWGHSTYGLFNESGRGYIGWCFSGASQNQ